MTIALTFIYLIAVFGFLVAALVYWVSRRREIRDCSRFAWGVVGGYCVLLVPLVFAAEGVRWVFAFALPIDAARTFLFTAVGVSCCAAAGVVAFPLVRPGLGSGEAALRRSPAAPILWGVLLAGTWSVYTLFLFHATNPVLSDAARNLFGSFDITASMAVAVLAVSVAAIGEELMFRLGIQNYIARIFGWWDQRYWLAILLSAALWSLGHAGTLEPDWVKIAQVFPAGLALGWLARKHGIEACILSHVVFNTGAFWMAEAGVLPV
ncbi:MAG: CPBP family intramembrane metalloprotease [Gammaproteobacteria bacterium]|nr:CPBP family intramembrane metalloprotease [Gammaproteobacteria bacterium]